MKYIIIPIIVSVMFLHIFLLVPNTIREQEKEKQYQEILEYRTEQDIMYITSSIIDNTGETFWLTTYGRDDSERKQYVQMCIKLTELDIRNTSIKDILAVIPEWDPKLYEDYRIALNSNGKGFEIYK